MTRPIAVRPGAILEITQQTHNREFRFKPTPAVRDICMYLLVYSLREYQMQLYGVLFMSNHLHLIVRDVYGRHPDFRRRFHSLLARALNHLQGERDHLVTSQEGSVVQILTLEDLFEKLVYMYLNPTADRLVKSVDQWPGANTYQSAMGQRVIARPKELFSGNTTLPDFVDLGDVIPDDLTPAQRKRLQRRVHERVKRDEVKGAIKRPWEGRGVMGVRALRAVHHKDTPATKRPLRGRRPVSVSKFPKVRRHQLRERREHVRDCSNSKKDLRKERRKPMHLRKRVTFPPGTFKLWRGGVVDRKATRRCGALPTYAEWLGLYPRRGDDEPLDYPTPG